MKSYDARALAAGAPSNGNRPGTALAYDAPDARVVVFRIDPGQAVSPHTSPSTVILSIAAGRGTVSGAEGERPVCAGDVIAYEPNEPHGMRADGEQLVVLAVIAPGPGRAR